MKFFFSVLAIFSASICSLCIGLNISIVQLYMLSNFNSHILLMLPISVLSPYRHGQGEKSEVHNS